MIGPLHRSPLYINIKSFIEQRASRFFESSTHHKLSVIFKMMFRIFVIAACSVVLSSGGITKSANIVVSEQQAEGSHYEELTSNYGGDYDAKSYDGGKQYAGAELTSLAQSSAVQAKNAVQSQSTAGSHASFGIQSTLASAALGAAQTAQAALVGKQAIVASIRRQLSEAESQLQGEIAQLEQTQQAAGYAAQAAQQAQSQTAALSAAIASAQGGEQIAIKAATEAGSVAASQQAMVNEAKQRIASLHHQLDSAVFELQETESAAYRAAESAQVAQSNAAAAGAAVAASSAKAQASTNAGADDFHHYHHH